LRQVSRTQELRYQASNSIKGLKIMYSVVISIKCSKTNKQNPGGVHVAGSLGNPFLLELQILATITKGIELVRVTQGESQSWLFPYLSIPRNKKTHQIR
jgi:hypothetical protein